MREDGPGVGAGDLDPDGRDEILVTTGWGRATGGHARCSGRLCGGSGPSAPTRSPAPGMNVAVGAAGRPAAAARTASTRSSARAAAGAGRRGALPRRRRARLDRRQLPRDDRLGRRHVVARRRRAPGPRRLRRSQHEALHEAAGVYQITVTLTDRREPGPRWRGAPPSSAGPDREEVEEQRWWGEASASRLLPARGA